MASSNAEVSSQALSGLQNNLSELSGKIQGICDTLNSDRERMGEAWRDSKFQEFRQGFQPQINKCSELSQKYSDYAKLLGPAIEQVVLIERAEVGGEGGGGSAGAVSVASVGTGVSGATPSAGIGGGGSIGSSFNLDGKKTAGSKSTSEVISGIDALLNKPKTKKPLSKADIECQKEFGSEYHGVPSSKDEAHVHWGGNTPGNNEVSSGLEVDLGIIKGKLGGKATDGSMTPEGWAKCEKD